MSQKEPTRPLNPLAGPQPARFEAVDRLMALATEKRADRIPAEPVQAALARVSTPQDEAASGPRATAAETAARVAARLRPMLPVMAGALRMVDHGAVQALARLLPLLTGAGSSSAADAAQARTAAQALAERREHGRELENLRLGLERTDEELAQVRSRCLAVEAQQIVLEQRLAEALSRARLLTNAVVVLVAVVVALAVLLFVHLRT